MVNNGTIYINSILPMVPLFFNEHDISSQHIFSSVRLFIVPNKFKQDPFFHMKIPLEKNLPNIDETFRVQWHLTT